MEQISEYGVSLRMTITESSEELLMVFDLNNLVLRCQAGMSKAGLTNKEGIPTGGLFGSIRVFNGYIQKLQPTHVACFWDFGRSVFRTQIQADYKGDRPKSAYLEPGEVQLTFHLFEQYLDLIRVFHYKEEGIEADDLIADCVYQNRDSLPITILSADHDLRQLVRQPDPYPVTVIKPSMSSTKTNESTYTYQSVIDEYKLPPHRLAELWSIEGDIGDCQPSGTKVLVRRRADWGHTRKCELDVCSCRDKKHNYHCLNCKSVFYSINHSWRCPECVANVSQPLHYVYIETPIEEVVVGDTVASYNGDVWTTETVQEVSCRDYEGQLVRVETEQGKVSRYTPEHRCMATIGGLSGYYCTYLMKRGIHFRVGMSRLGEKVYRWQEEGAESLWILSVHKDKDECLLEEQLLSFKYGLPDLTFSGSNFSVTQEVTEKLQTRLDRFWDTVGDLTTRAQICLQEYGLLSEFPHFSKLDFNKRTAISSKYLAESRAANLITGMSVAVRVGTETRLGTGHREQIEVSRESYRGQVYSLRVSGSQLYVADGILTHNCIKGVPGFGPVKALKALQEHGTLSQAIACHPKFAGFERQIHNNFRMIKLPSEVVPSYRPEITEFVFPKVVNDRDLEDFFREYELNSLLLKLEAGTLFKQETGMRTGFGNI